MAAMGCPSIGLQENTDKAQFWHQAAAGRRKLVEAGCPTAQIKTDMRIRGYHFRALQDCSFGPNMAPWI